MAKNPGFRSSEAWIVLKYHRAYPWLSSAPGMGNSLAVKVCYGV